MQISSRFTVAVHMLLCVEYFAGRHKATSDFIASSVGVNPVVVRRTLGQLKAAGLVRVEAGVGGATLARDPADVTLLDVFRAVESVGGAGADAHKEAAAGGPESGGGTDAAAGGLASDPGDMRDEASLFSFHERPNPACPVGRAIHPVLDGELAAAQQALEDRLAQTTLADLLARVEASAA